MLAMVVLGALATDAHAALGGAFLGAVSSIPLLVFTLLLFGVPVAIANRQAAKGLAGAERGDRTVGVTSAVWSLLALVALLRASDSALPTERAAWATRVGLAILGAGLGSAAIVVVAARERTRRRFLARVANGEDTDYRIDTTPEGSALIELSQPGDYRAAAGCLVLLLDATGAAIGPPRDPSAD